MKNVRVTTPALILLSTALVALAFVGPFRDVAVLFWVAGFVVLLRAFAVAMRTSKPSEGQAERRHEREKPHRSRRRL